MMNLNARERDEFLKALEEARRAAMATTRRACGRASPSGPYGGIEFLHAIDHMAGKVRSYISAGLLSRLYGEGFLASAADGTAPEPPPPPKSEHERWWTSCTSPRT